MIHFDIPNLETNLKTLETETTKPEFWEDSQNSNKVLSKIKSIKGKCQKYRDLENEINNTIELVDLLKMEYDEELALEMIKDIKKIEKDLEKFEIEGNDKNYFVTSFDLFSLKKGMDIFKNINIPMNLTKIEFTYETSKEDEEYLNYISLEYKINWNSYALYFQILGEDNKVFEENQRLEKIRFRRLSINYKDSLAYVIQDICKNENMSKIKRTMKD